MARFSRAARAGDSIRGKCNMHIHTKHHHCWHFLSGSCRGGGNVYIEGKQAQRAGDEVSFSGCQHGGSPGHSVEGSKSVFINGKAAVRIKDEGSCGRCGQRFYHTTGANSVFIGD